MKTKKILSFLLILALVFINSGCGSSAGSIQATALYVEVNTIGVSGGAIIVRADSISGQNITDATVSANGVNFPYNSSLEKYYSWNSGFSASAGDTITVTVSWHGMTVTGQSTLPYPANITSPAEGASLSVAAITTVNWNYAAGQQPNQINVTGADGVVSITSGFLSGDVITYDIPAGTFSAGSGRVFVDSFNQGTVFTGPAATGSVINLLSSNSVGVTWIP